MTIGDNRFSGTWSPIFESFAGLNGEIGDIRVMRAEGESFLDFVSVASLRINHRLARRDNGRWNGAFEVAVSGVQSDDATIGGMQVAWNIREFAIEDWRRIVDRFGLDEAGSDHRFSAEEAKQIAGALKNVHWGAATARLSFSNVLAGEAGKPLFGFDSQTTKFKFHESKGRATLGFSVSLTNLAVFDEDTPPELMPRQANLDLSIENLPLVVAILPVVAMIEAGSQEAAALAAIVALTTDPASLGEAPPVAVLHDMTYRSAVIEITAKGSLTGALDSANGVYGKLDVAVSDLDELLEFAKSGGGKAVAWAEDIRPCVRILKEVGAFSPPIGEERALHRFHFVFPRDGTQTVNDRPLGVLQGCAAGQAAPERAAIPIQLELPVDCEIGESCFIQFYVDRDPGPGAIDYRCGILTTDGRDAIAIRVPDLVAMKRGVAVVAAAEGIVKANRDTEPDISIDELGIGNVRGKEAGNSVVLTHDGGWQTQYSHLMQGSVAVQPGQRVSVGDRLGLIGLSGLTNFPHLEFGVRRNGVAVDPFVGPDAPSGCDAEGKPLWTSATLAKLSYVPGGVLLAGFAGRIPDELGVRAGAHSSLEFSSLTPALVFWTDVYGIRAGDVESFKIIAPDGAILVEHEQMFKSEVHQRFYTVGKRRVAGAAWSVGVYRGEYDLIRMVDGKNK